MNETYLVILSPVKSSALLNFYLHPRRFVGARLDCIKFFNALPQFHIWAMLSQLLYTSKTSCVAGNSFFANQDNLARDWQVSSLHRRTWKFKVILFYKSSKLHDFSMTSATFCWIPRQYFQIP